MRADGDADEQFADNDGQLQPLERFGGDSGAKVDEEDVEEDAGNVVHRWRKHMEEPL